MNKQQELDDLYAQLAPILDNLLVHQHEETESNITTCFWCWYYEFALDKIMQLESSSK